MRFMKKMGMLSVFILALIFVVTACGSNDDQSQDNGSASNNTSSDTSSEEKIPLTLMFAWPGDEQAAKEEELVREKFGDKYDLTFRAVDGNVERTIKTTISAGDPVDLSFFWMTDMGTFVDGDMALDLTPYLEENDNEWKNNFIEGSLDMAAYDNKVYGVPYGPTYPLMLVNLDLLEKAGVTISDQPSWDEFTSVLATVNEELDIHPLGVAGDHNWQGWLIRNNLFGVWEDVEDVKKWGNGEISFEHPNVNKVFEKVTDLYDQEFLYPGQGALTVTNDEVIRAFSNGEIAFMASVNQEAPDTVEVSGLENVHVITFPSMGERNQVMGTANGYMIPANVKNPEAAVEILKYLTSPEVLQYRVDAGLPVSGEGMESENPLNELYSQDAGNIYREPEIASISTELSEHLNENMPANYIFDPERAMEELEKLRLEAIE